MNILVLEISSKGAFSPFPCMFANLSKESLDTFVPILNVVCKVGSIKFVIWVQVYRYSLIEMIAEMIKDIHEI